METNNMADLMKGKDLALRPYIGGYQVTDADNSRHSYAFISAEDLHEPDPARVVFSHDGYTYELIQIPKKKSTYRLHSCVSTWSMM